jgi:hypothetical protein
MILVWWEGGVMAGPKECSVWLLQHGPAEVADYMVSFLMDPQATQEVTAVGMWLTVITYKAPMDVLVKNRNNHAKYVGVVSPE